MYSGFEYNITSQREWINSGMIINNIDNSLFNTNSLYQYINVQTIKMFMLIINRYKIGVPFELLQNIILYYQYNAYHICDWPSYSRPMMCAPNINKVVLFPNITQCSFLSISTVDSPIDGKIFFYNFRDVNNTLLHYIACTDIYSKKLLLLSLKLLYVLDTENNKNVEIRNNMITRMSVKYFTEYINYVASFINNMMIKKYALSLVDTHKNTSSNMTLFDITCI